MIKILLYVPLLILFIISNSFSFELNMTKDEILRINTKYLLKDLSVGDKMNVPLWEFCNYNGKLALLDTTPFQPKSKYSPNYILTILPSSTVSLEIDKKDSNGKKWDLTDMLPSSMISTCDQNKKDLNLSQAKIFTVKSINGFKNLKEYVNNLLQSGYKSD